MAFAWKLAIPASLVNLVVVATVVYAQQRNDWELWLAGGIISVVSIALAVVTGFIIQRRREQRLNQFRQRWAQ